MALSRRRKGGRRAADIDKRIAKLYHADGLQLFWIKNEKPDARAVQILDALKDAGSQGLAPADYFVDKIEQYWDSADAGNIVRLDILLTVGMLRYVADQREGRITPSTFTMMSMAVIDFLPRTVRPRLSGIVFPAQFDVHPNRIQDWKARLVSQAEHLFENGIGLLHLQGRL